MRWNLTWPVRPHLFLTLFEIYLVLSLNLVGIFAEGLPATRKFIRRNYERRNEEVGYT
jgi:hypothetical protein